MRDATIFHTKVSMSSSVSALHRCVVLSKCLPPRYMNGRGSKGERMATVLKEAKIALIDLRIRFLRPDVALAHELHEMNGMLTEDGQRMPPHRELGIRVLVKEQGKWLTTAFHNTLVRDAGQRAPAIN